jgi:hypothetical protein
MVDAFCPECGCTLSVGISRDNKNGTIVINLFCEGFADDIFKISIDTHLTNENLRKWNSIGSTRKATMKLENRIRDPFESVDMLHIEYEGYQEK